MTIPKEAIEKAIEGGWTTPLLRANPKADIAGLLDTGHFEREQEKIALDPSFWQALGKALGWRLEDDKWSSPRHWRKFVHRFLDVVLTSGDTDGFWSELLKCSH